MGIFHKSEKERNLYLPNNRPGLQILRVPWPDDPVNNEK